RSGIVDEDVDSAEALDAIVDRTGDSVAGREIGDRHDGAVAHRGCDTRERFGIAADDGHAGSFRSERGCGCCADAAAAAGDDRSASPESEIHGRAPYGLP